MLAQVVAEPMTNATPFGPITWPVVLAIGAYLVLLGVQIGNLIWLRSTVDELKKAFHEHLAEDQERLSALELDAVRMSVALGMEPRSRAPRRPGFTTAPEPGGS